MTEITSLDCFCIKSGQQGANLFILPSGEGHIYPVRKVRHKSQ